jgi:hypothetical protein
VHDCPTSETIASARDAAASLIKTHRKMGHVKAGLALLPTAAFDWATAQSRQAATGPKPDISLHHTSPAPPESGQYQPSHGKFDRYSAPT